MNLKRILKRLPKYQPPVESQGVRTLQVGDRLLIMDGKSPLRYVDLTKNIVKVYKPVKKIKVHIYEEVKPTSTMPIPDNADGVVNEGGKLYLVYIR